jgi:hypothetical protein
MKLGKQTGSVINHLQSLAVIGQPVPTVGMGATLLGWTDRYPGTIIKVDTAGARPDGVTTYVHVQDDTYKLVGGSCMSEAQTYEYTPDPEGSISVFRSKDGSFWEEVRRNRETGRWNATRGKGLRIGERNRYYDPTF